LLFPIYPSQKVSSFQLELLKSSTVRADDTFGSSDWFTPGNSNTSN